MSMISLRISFKGQTHALSISSSSTIGELQVQILRLVDIQPDAQRLFQNRRRLDCSDVSRLLTDICDCSDDASPLLVMVGASTAQIQDMKQTQVAIQRESQIRERRRVVDISKRNQGLHRPRTQSTSYRFHAIEPLPNFADVEKAREILNKLANNRGILAVMEKHKWSVGVLAEMPPDGKVGVDPVCVLGLNQNKGQKILLRLRTDDLLGFRKFLSIKKVLFHELSHNVHSDHDSKFYQLMRQVEKECNELDWTSSHGASVGGSRAAMFDGVESENSSSSGNRLGGGSAGTSRLLYIVPQKKSASVPVSTPEQQGPIDLTQPGKEDQQPVAAEIPVSEDVEMTEADDEVAELTQPLVHEKTVDEEVATLAMSDRERRIHDAVQHLHAHYSSDISKAASLLHKIVSNIISHPDAKFRSIRKANRLFDDQVAKFPECLAFLLALGFEDQLDKFVLVREDPALLWIGRSTLEVLLPDTA